ncbi:MAG: hypothetical protein P0Y56_02685 [Candidatus Andeanibacterium colombiense]|uniref:DUF4352 domain-containing protein n=1 Tax=Candidatus Andeanibacterium colombiense TaxID=3121345 RepID=A0AAJ5X7L7_9SPHN|nr:MAG: hypothetical protein P0Y56_02685 [Sphingomonadaceae bacterium]
MIKRLLLLSACLLLPAPASAAGDGVTLGKLTAQLYYKNSGTLSRDVLNRTPPVSFWNTGAGEGDVQEPAEDMVVSVTLANASDDGVFLDETLELWVTDARGKQIARRNFKGILVPYNGKVANPLWLQDIQCAGRLTFHAKFRGKEVRGQVSMDCGE